MEVPKDVVDAAIEMTRACLASRPEPRTVESLNVPEETIHLHANIKGEQGLVLIGRLEGGDRFEAHCFVKLPDKGRVRIKFRTGQEKDGMCAFHCVRQSSEWNSQNVPLKNWDSEST
jgi:hypothetical protein